MEKRGFLGLLFLMLCLTQNFASAQNISNEGTDFWAVFPTHDPSKNRSGIPNSLANVRIYITSKVNSEVVVSCGSFSTGPIPIPANTAVPVDIPREDAYIEDSKANFKLPNKAIHIVVSPGHEKVSVFEHIYAGARSAASLILPQKALGREYFSMNFDQDFNSNEISKNFLVLVATEDNTSLIVKKTDGSEFKIEFLSAGDVYEYLPDDQEDLTGTHVFIDPASPDNCTKRFAAFSGSTSLRINCSGSRDPLFQQLYPVNSWGKEYGVVPFINRMHNVRILAQDDDTEVSFDGTTFNLDKGQFRTFSRMTDASIVSANKKVSVAQYSLTQDCSSTSGQEIIGDPEMVLLNPIEFNVKATTLFSSDKERIVDRYINVFMKTSATSTFKIDGVAVMMSWSVVPSAPDYSFTQIRINSESSYLTANDGFNALAYGFGDHESYAYSAGTNLATNNYLLVNNKITNRDALSACIGQLSDFKIILPAPAVRIEWKLDSEPMFIDASPKSTVIIRDNGSLYEYTFPAGKMFDTNDSHKMSVYVEFAPVDGCLGALDTYEYQFDVDPVPIADFTIPKSVFCELETIQFTDASNSLNPAKPVNKWLWDFGDGSTSEEQSPIHHYTKPNLYTVKLFSGVDDGCMSEVVSRAIHVDPAPRITFNPISAVCITDPSVQINTAVVYNGISGRGEYSGPGITDPKGLFDPTIAGSGTHTITYSYKNANGCEDIKTQTILVSPLPVLFFGDDIYILKGGSLRLNIKGDGQKSTYKWSPMDQLLDNPDVLNPLIYSGEMDRQYTLTVTTDGGCTLTKTINVHVVNSLEPANAFSPNDDGINDIWEIKYIETYPNTTVQVFNRMGETVFFSKNYNQPFDGRYNGKGLPVGTYYYIIDPKNGRPRLTGSLTIIR